MKNEKMISVDGNTAAAYIGYALSDVACVFPITPSTPMAELCDEWASKNQKNIFNTTVKVVEMQSEAGAAGAVHGSAATGALTTTYTASQGLLLMIPNMYKIAGECLPVVFHVSARTIAAQAINIFGDHQDVMACRQTGFCMLASNNVQEAMDMALVAHISALKGSLPFLHFFDGFRTSHEINKIEEIPYTTIKKMLPKKEIDNFRKNGFNPHHPKLVGPCQNGDTYFQNREASNCYYDRIYNIVEETMDRLGELTGRKYAPFEYYGANNAENVVVIMCSGADTVHETIDSLPAGHKNGVLKVHLYRPFNGKAFCRALPKTVKKLTVLDRTKEPGSIGEPLYLDVVMALKQEKRDNIQVCAGRYGLGGKEFTPNDVMAIFKNMEHVKMKQRFTVGIDDDVTMLSLAPVPAKIKNNYVECKFWGLGSDGTISANKSSIKIIGQNTNKFVQGYFEYDSKKSGGLTISHLRMSDTVIRSPYFLQTADFIAVHNFVYVNMYDVLQGLKQRGTVLLNTIYSADEVGKYLPEYFKEKIAEKKAKLYVIDAYKVANEAGLRNRINVIMQSCFFKISNIIDYKLAETCMKESAIKLYSKKGDAVIAANMKAIDAAVNDLYQVDVNKMIKQKTIDVKNHQKVSDYYKKFCGVIASHQGDTLKVSQFQPDGSVPTGTTKYEKRCIGQNVPVWDASKCVQCGQCTLVCPHAAIRGGLYDEVDIKKRPESFTTIKALGAKSGEYRVQVSPRDCTGCASCSKVCPTKALQMVPTNKALEMEEKNYEYSLTLKQLPNPYDKKTVKGVQFEKPYFEFSGACAGCGETPYIKLITQLYGKKMMIANATGCSSIYSSSSPTVPYCTDENGCGPSWGNSLFEDNAEYGYGIALAMKYRRDNAYAILENLIQSNEVNDHHLQTIAQNLIKHKDDDDNQKYVDELIFAAKNFKGDCQCVSQILENKDLYDKKSIWIFGGDGWAYDIGFGGLDHVLASGENVNILVMDTEVYSNTGGQASKSSPQGAVAKFAASGKATRKKDLGAIAMTYKDVYVAQVCMGANQAQVIKAISEAEAYNGVSLIIAYSPCINHGFDMSSVQAEMKKAVTAGYWHLYRYNPSLKQNKLTIDSADPSTNYSDFLMGEARYASLMKKNPEVAKKLFADSENSANDKLATLKQLTEK